MDENKKETKTYQNGLSKTCRYRDNSMNRVCYFGGKATYIESCIGCHEDGRNANGGADATAFAERGGVVL